MSRPRRDWALARGPRVVAAVTAAVVGAVVALRYLTFHAPAYDLGFFDQVAEQTAQGHLFASSFVAYPFLGEHWEPLLGIVAQLDRIVATPLWLLAIVTVAAGAAPWAAARLARTWLPAHPSAPLVAAMATACFPLVTSGMAFDYHTEVLSPAVALFALDAAANRRPLRFVLLLLLLATVKEDALLLAAGVGWVAWRADRSRLGLATVAGGLAGFLVLAGVVMPFFRGGAAGDLLGNYAWLAPGSTSVWPIVVGGLTHPGAVIGRLLASPALGGLALAVLPLALLPLLSGWALLGAVPVLLVSLLSSDTAQAQLHFHYGLEAAPLLLACALLGWRRVAHRRVGRRLPAALLVAASATAYVVAAPLPGGLRFNAAAVAGLDRRAAVEEVLARLPAGAEVSAQTGLVAHVSNRPAVWEFPGGQGARYVVIDDGGPVSTQASEGYEAALQSLATKGYRVVAHKAGVTLWER